MTTRSLRWAPIFVIVFAVLALLPAFWIPLGLPTEGDAVSYRVPILKWILRHGTYPNWPWTYVEDYPMLGELLMLPFFVLTESLARIVPIFFYLASAAFAAALSLELFPAANNTRKDQFIFSFACTLSIHPLLLQSNALMVDNIATAFSLAALYFFLRDKTKFTVAASALALATRYSAWGLFPGLLLASIWLSRKRTWLLALALIGAIPFLLRNQILNQNPFFPLLHDWIQGQQAYPFDVWGRGKGLVAILLFPFDLLITNSFVNPIFDIPQKTEIKIYPHHFTLYTVGFFFQALVLLSLAVAVGTFSSFKDKVRRNSRDARIQAALLIFGCHFLSWWFGSQQLRFLGPELALCTGVLSIFLYRSLPKYFSFSLLIVAFASITNVHMYTWKLALGKIPLDRDMPFVQEQLKCIKSLGLQKGEVVGRKNPALTLGYGDYDFMYLPPYPHYYPSEIRPDYIVDEPLTVSIPEYDLWPRENPCAFKKRII